ncbi:MAG: cation-transporting P-type ATPase [Clostridium sp.]|nr:cation-transporting P-type ATPase [Clostridium sp.]
MTDWYNLAWNDVVNLMQSNENRGLSDEEVILNREKYGQNKIEGIPRKKIVVYILKNIFQPWVIFNLSGSIIYLLLGECVNFEILFAILIINLIMIIKDKYKEQRGLNNFEKFNTGTCTAIRNGNLTVIKNEEVVVGDIVVYKKGDIIPADLRIMDCEDLTAGEEAVTGDNNTVEKYSAKLMEYDLSLSEMRNILFKSSIIRSGSGEGIVVASGMNTEIGKFMQTLLELEGRENKFYIGIQYVLNVMSIIGFCGAALIFVNKGNFENVVTGFISSVPFEIILLINIIYYIVKLIYKSKGIYFKDISKIQTISNLDVLVSKKEGIFTKNYVAVKKIYDTENIQDWKKELKPNDNFNRILEISTLCNDLSSISDNTDIVENALLRFGKDNGMIKANIEFKQKRMFKLPYDKEKRITTTVNRVERNYRAYVRGAVDVLINECTQIMKNGIEKEITKEDIEEIKAADMQMSNECLNVIGLAYRNFSYRPSVNENIESNLVFAGLVGLENPVKEEMNISINRSKLIALKPVVYTEDSKLTAQAYGVKTGILNIGDMAISGIEIDNMANGEFERNIEKVGMFSRILSSHKMKIINAYKSLGYSTAITGEKLMDLPSLKIADLSIAIGKHCGNTVKKISDVYAESIDFKQIVDNVFESRSIVNCINEIVKLICTFSLSQFVLFVLSMTFYKQNFIDFNQIMWMNIMNSMLISLGVFLCRKTLIIETDEKISLNKENYKNKVGSILFNSILLALFCIVDFNFQTGDSLYLKGMGVFAVMCTGQAILSFKMKFFKNIYFDIIVLLYVFFNYMLIDTSFGSNILGFNTMGYYNKLVFILTIIIYMFFMLIKGFFTGGSYNATMGEY